MGSLTLPRTGSWYGATLAWQLLIERGLRAEHHGDVTRRLGVDLTVPETLGWLEYRHAGLFVPGRDEAVPVTVRFYEWPLYSTFGLRPQDYPRIFADPGAESPHRMPDDDALCLYSPWHAPERRWTSQDSLLMLLNLVRDHLFFEQWWRRTRSETCAGVWLGAEEPHGSPTRRAS